MSWFSPSGEFERNSKKAGESGHGLAWLREEPGGCRDYARLAGEERGRDHERRVVGRCRDREYLFVHRCGAGGERRCDPGIIAGSRSTKSRPGIDCVRLSAAAV